MKLLYRTSEWHGLAKLRMHTETSLALLESLTTEFGLLIQNFQEMTCSQFATTEPPREGAAQQRCEPNNDAARPSRSDVNQTAILAHPASESSQTSRRRVLLQAQTVAPMRPLLTLIILHPTLTKHCAVEFTANPDSNANHAALLGPAASGSLQKIAPPAPTSSSCKCYAIGNA